jgi:hypothetical protein
MAWNEVISYTLSWWYEGSKGEIVLTLKEGNPISCKSLRYGDYAAMVDILRHEKRVWYEDKHSLLMACHDQPKELATNEIKTP